jgi:ubiquinone/menaquinone biosynthesis C-methylase UbiE
MTYQYYQTRESAESYIKVAKEFDGQELIHHLGNFIQKGSTVLELGTGPGTDLEILSQSYHVTGSDFSQHFLDILIEKKIQNELLLLNAITLEVDSTFDCIYSNKVLQHLTNDELLLSIQNQLQILKDGGIVCHSFWAGTDSYEMKGAFHNYHTIEELEDWFSPYFKIQFLKFYDEMEKDDSILLIGQKR